MGEKPITYNHRKNRWNSFRKRHHVRTVLDSYAAQLEELFFIRNPQFRFNPNFQDELRKFSHGHYKGKDPRYAGKWFYFLWNGILAHYLPDAMHQEIRTARNRNLITREEQEKFYNFKVGVAGLSVGSHAALTVAMMGGARVMKLADPDVISASNLNRIRQDFMTVGQKKSSLVARTIYQINPYAKIWEYDRGLNKRNMREFLAGPPKLDVLLEQVDNLEMKILLRLEARKLNIPVLMATDNGDNIIIDIERYDINPKLKLFNGAAGNLTLEEFQRFKPQDLPRLATKIAGPALIVPRMLASLGEVGKTLYSWPQLGSAATLSGVALAYAVRRLAVGENLKTGKFEVNLDSIFDPGYGRAANVRRRAKLREKFLKKMGF